MDELLLLTLSEEFFENEGAVRVRAQPDAAEPQPPGPRGASRASCRPARATTRATGSASLSMPVHVIGGEHDILVPVWKSEELAELIPGAQADGDRARTARDAVERAQEFNELVLDFIAEHERAAA